MTARYANVYDFLTKQHQEFHWMLIQKRKKKIKIALHNKKILLLLCSDNLLAKRSVKKKQFIEMFVMNNLSI